MKMGSCYGLRLKILKNLSRQKQTKYDLTINNISSSLAVLLKQEKKNLLNENAAKIIPEEFASMHSWAFSDYMRDDSLRTKRSQFLTDTIERKIQYFDNSGSHELVQDPQIA